MTDVVSARGLAKRFGDVIAVDGADLDVEDGELVALLGPSGCGKTTVLRLLAGLERPDAGTIQIRDRRVAGGDTWIPPEHRRVGLVFQEWALFPHLDVRSNVAFGLPKGSTDAVDGLLDLVHLRDVEHRMPHELSGGQQQRVALARALAPGPDVLLLDEPFSNLDAQLRADVRAEVQEILSATGTTTVLVTHDQEEALAIADRVAVMLEGRIRQVGSPFEIYGRPADGQVARLLGQANLLPGTVRDGVVVCALGAIGPPIGVRALGGPIEVLVRPETVRAVPDADGPATVSTIEFYGHDQLVRCHLDEGSVVQVRSFGAHADLGVGTRVRLELIAPPTVLPIRAQDGDSARR